MLSTMQLYRWICLGRRSCGACIALAEGSSKLWACAVSLESSAVVGSCGGGFGERWRTSFCSSFLSCQLNLPSATEPSQPSHCHLALDHVHVSPRAYTCSHDFLTSQDQLNRIFCSLQAETQPVVRQSGSCQLLRTSNHVLMWEC